MYIYVRKDKAEHEEKTASTMFEFLTPDLHFAAHCSPQQKLTTVDFFLELFL